MASATETAIKALIAALTKVASTAETPFPAPTRNNTLPARFTSFVPAYSDVKFFFNVNDGNGKVIQETLGQPDVVANTYEIQQRVEIELVVQSANDDNREAAFDAALVGINSALAADRSFGGAAEWAVIDETVRSNLVTDALPNTKGIVVYVVIDFQSSLPF